MFIYILFLYAKTKANYLDCANKKLKQLRVLVNQTECMFVNSFPSKLSKLEF